jgi:hypothetical protein
VERKPDELSFVAMKSIENKKNIIIIRLPLNKKLFDMKVEKEILAPIILSQEILWMSYKIKVGKRSVIRETYHIFNIDYTTDC